MPESNVLAMPAPLARLADKIKADLERCHETSEHWRDAATALCIDLAEARAQFAANIEFGAWCEQNGFGENVLNKNDRAAAIAMGKNIELARPILQITERRSFDRIYRNECRFPPTRKTTKKSEPKKSRGKLTDEQALEVARLVLDEGLTHEDAGKRFGVSDKTAKIAVSKEQGRRESLDPARFTKPTREQFDRAIRMAVAQAREQFEDEVRERVQKRFDEVYIPHAFAKAEYADEILATRKGIMTREEFRKILSCLHPDTAQPAWRDRCAEAFALFKTFERLLVKAEPSGIPTTELPRTVEELLARRKRGR